jgi:chorismate dehydratase
MVDFPLYGLRRKIPELSEMQAGKDLRVGYIPYLNCVPFFHYLAAKGFTGTISSGVPSALNRMLQAAEVDVSPSSSFEYGLNFEHYLLLPNYSISSRGPVKSVLLFSPCPLVELQDRPIAITGDSATSINLLRVLLLEYVGLRKVDDFVPSAPVEALIAQRQPALLIGDRAMHQASRLPAGMNCFDLGELWYQYTGLPFVFALWILRRDIARTRTREIADLEYLLAASLAEAFADLPLLAKLHATDPQEFSALVSYWQTIDYALTQKHLSGLALFFRLCLKYGYFKKLPEIEFFHG